MDNIDKLLHYIDMVKSVGHSLFSKCVPDWSWTVQSLPDFDLWYVSFGRGKMILNGNEIPLAQGTALLLEPGSRIEAWKNPHDELHVYAAHFVPDKGETFRLIANRAVDVGKGDFFKELFKRHLNSAGKGDECPQLWLEALLNELAARSLGQERKGNSSLQKKICLMAGQIEEDPEFDWTVHMLASRAALCKDHFIRLFKDSVGKTPAQFIIEARLKKAGHLLSESDLPVYRIGELCGFESTQWFCRLFRRKRGLSPGEYRKARR